jgi:hypothetical protein
MTPVGPVVLATILIVKMPKEEWIVPPVRTPLNGDEEFEGMNGNVGDFWRFALPNLQMNNARGYFAEYLVARGLGMWGDPDFPVSVLWFFFYAARV